MRRSRVTPAHVLQALRQAERGTVVGEICRKLGVIEARFFRWRKQYAGLDVGKLRERPVRKAFEPCVNLLFADMRVQTAACSVLRLMERPMSEPPPRISRPQSAFANHYTEDEDVPRRE
jgi:putative transposase